MFSKLTIRHQNVVNNVVLETLVLTLNRYIFVFFFFFFFFFFFLEFPLSENTAQIKRKYFEIFHFCIIHHFCHFQVEVKIKVVIIFFVWCFQTAMVFFIALKLWSSYSHVLRIGNVITFKLFILFGSFLTSAIITQSY